jgi:hypothetical protein
MQTNTLFFFVFLSQILVISFYLPRTVLNRVKYVFEAYPPAKYPNLYPEPIEKYERAWRNYRNVNLFILLAGLLLMPVLFGYSRSGEWDETIVTTYFMVQFSPMILMEIGALKYYKLMRKTDSRTTRKADLHPRRLFDFISPTLIGLAIFVYFAFIGFILYVRQFEFPWFGGYWNIVIVTAGNIFFAGIIFWHLYGKKMDPYQAYEDRIRQIALTVKKVVFISIAVTLYLVIIVLLASLDLRSLQPTVLSLYLQLVAVIGFRTLQIDTINFEVYKEDVLVVGQH